MWIRQIGDLAKVKGYEGGDTVDDTATVVVCLSEGLMIDSGDGVRGDDPGSRSRLIE